MFLCFILYVTSESDRLGVDVVADMKKRIICAFVVLLIVVGSLLFYHSRVVAVANGNNIIYNDTLYTESFESFDFEIGTYLGRVCFDPGTSYSTTCRLYTLVGMPEYLFVDMGLIDWRIYKQLSD